MSCFFQDSPSVCLCSNMTTNHSLLHLPECRIRGGQALWLPCLLSPYVLTHTSYFPQSCYICVPWPLSDYSLRSFLYQVIPLFINCQALLISDWINYKFPGHTDKTVELSVCHFPRIRVAKEVNFLFHQQDIFSPLLFPRISFSHFQLHKIFFNLQSLVLTPALFMK